MPVVLACASGMVAWMLVAVGWAVVPRLLAVAAVRAQYRQQARRATSLRRLAFLLRPTRAHRFARDLSESFEHAVDGDLESARSGLSFWSEKHPYRQHVRLQLARWAADWPKVLSLCPPEGGELSERMSRLRATGELARPETFEKLWQRDLTAFRHVSTRDSAWLYLFAFGGRPDLVKLLLFHRLPQMSAPLRCFWTETAALAGGDPKAIERLRSLTSESDATLRAAAHWRLSNGPFAPLVSEGVISEQARTFDQVLRFGRNRSTIKPVATSALVALMVIGFAAQSVLNQWLDAEEAMLLGAMSASDVILRGQWWRVVSYAWLHHGLGHLLVNLVALLVIGAWIERWFGARRLFAIYLTSCLGATLLPLLAWQVGLVEEQAIVGASGGVMGLVGAMAAVFLRGVLEEQAQAARRGLGVVSTVVLLQAMLDLALPQISFLTHASGFVVGCVLGFAVLKKRTPDLAQRARTPLSATKPGAVVEGSTRRM